MSLSESPRVPGAASPAGERQQLDEETRLLMHRAFRRVTLPWQTRSLWAWWLEPEHVNAVFDAVAVPLLATVQQRDAEVSRLTTELDAVRGAEPRTMPDAFRWDGSWRVHQTDGEAPTLYLGLSRGRELRVSAHHAQRIGDLIRYLHQPESAAARGTSTPSEEHESNG